MRSFKGTKIISKTLTFAAIQFWQRIFFFGVLQNTNHREMNFLRKQQYF